MYIVFSQSVTYSRVLSQGDILLSHPVWDSLHLKYIQAKYSIL